MTEITNEVKDEAREPIFAVDTVLDMKRYVRFNVNHSLGNRGFIIFMGAMTAFIVLTFIFSLAMLGFDAQLMWCTVGILLLDAVYLLLIFFIPRLVFKRSASFMSLSHLEFFDDGFTEDTKASTTTAHTEHSYDALHKLSESNEDIYLYIAPNQAYIVDKCGFTKGNPDSLKRFLYTKVEPKIVKYKS